ncbi:MAG: hypothetical protein JSW47_12410 [Phycisphaerales bacterium]|nr:MAG: hypothetical protein JSW47_12410 [Phycisphaerales bacterium]
MSIGAGNIVPRIYYYLTPAFILLDYFGVANIRVAVFDSMPLYKNVYYGFCVFCGVVVFFRPMYSLVVGLFESSINILMIVLVLFLPYIRFINQMDDILTAELPTVAGFDAPCIGNLLMAGTIAVISFRGCVYQLTMVGAGTRNGRRLSTPEGKQASTRRNHDLGNVQ